MRTVVRKDELIEVLTTNREAHRGLFEKAFAKYRERVIADLEQKLDDAKNGRHFDQYIRYPVPEDHTSDYDRIIRMVEMGVAVEIELSENEVAAYIMDDWQWKQAWTTTNSAYLGVGQ